MGRVLLLKFQQVVVYQLTLLVVEDLKSVLKSRPVFSRRLDLL